VKKFNRKIPRGKNKIKINVQEFIKIGNAYKNENENLKALDSYKKAAELNFYDGIYFLAETWKEIYPDKRCAYIEDKISAWKNFAIANKNSKLLNLIGNFYYEGRVVEENLKKAIEFFCESAEMKNPTALVNLGKIYEDEKNFEKAFEFYKNAAKLGNQIAMIEIYLMYKEGRGVQKNKKQAAFWYEKIKNKLPTVADDMYEIAHNYTINGFFNNNHSNYANFCYKTAMKYFQKAVSYGKIEAYEDIGKFYLRGQGVKKNLEKAMEYFSKYGNWRALARSYLEGEDVEQDTEKAINYFSMSGDWFEIGEIYRIGKYLPQDFKKAEEFYLKYLETYKPEDEYYVKKIATMYRDGENYKPFAGESFEGDKLPQNAKLALKFFELAEDYLEIGNIYLQGDGIEKDGEKALKYFQKALAKKEIFAYLTIGDMYLNGNGVEKNLEQAKYYYEQLINKSYNDGKYHDFNFVSYGNGGKYVYPKTPDPCEEFLTNIAERRIEKILSDEEVENKND